MAKRKPITVVADAGHDSADWIKKLPSTEEDRAASDEALKRIRKKNAKKAAKRSK